MDIRDDARANGLVAIDFGGNEWACVTFVDGDPLPHERVKRDDIVEWIKKSDSKYFVCERAHIQIPKRPASKAQPLLPERIAELHDHCKESGKVMLSAPERQCKKRNILYDPEYGNGSGKEDSIDAKILGESFFKYRTHLQSTPLTRKVVHDKFRQILVSHTNRQLNEARSGDYKLHSWAHNFEMDMVVDAISQVGDIFLIDKCVPDRGRFMRDMCMWAKRYDAKTCKRLMEISEYTKPKLWYSAFATVTDQKTGMPIKIGGRFPTMADRVACFSGSANHGMMGVARSNEKYWGLKPFNKSLQKKRADKKYCPCGGSKDKKAADLNSLCYYCTADARWNASLYKIVIRDFIRVAVRWSMNSVSNQPLGLEELIDRMPNLLYPTGVEVVANKKSFDQYLEESKFEFDNFVSPDISAGIDVNEAELGDGLTQEELF